MTATKYVALNTRTFSDSQPNVFLSVELAEKVRGSSNRTPPIYTSWVTHVFFRRSFKNDLVDEIELMIIPITLGAGKRLFTNGTIPASCKVIESQISPNGIIIVNYKQDGDVKTGALQIEENE